MSDDRRSSMEGWAFEQGRVYQAGRDLTVHETVLATRPSVEHVAAPPGTVNLPGHVGLFVGRDEELAAVKGALETGGEVVVAAVHGLGGVGKSTLAAHYARALVATGGERVAMAPDLLRELGGKDEEMPELVAVAGLPDDELSRIKVGPSFLGAVFDRPNNPGNVGTMARSLDVFGGTGLIVTGHAADPYDPRSVRASTGSRCWRCRWCGPPRTGRCWRGWSGCTPRGCR
ncbi:TrmH family RNA methyltransferase [Nonomuraea sp. NPDC051941]|uniref:TrmH family RNA methyltransferase n=1 Tax=Nonomuraea sp. NPDC051941 TaxID=3364373 RepID=UPI0037C80128